MIKKIIKFSSYKNYIIIIIGIIIIGLTALIVFLILKPNNNSHGSTSNQTKWVETPETGVPINSIEQTETKKEQNLVVPQHLIDPVPQESQKRKACAALEKEAMEKFAEVYEALKAQGYGHPGAWALAQEAADKVRQKAPDCLFWI